MEDCRSLELLRETEEKFPSENLFDLGLLHIFMETVYRVIVEYIFSSSSEFIERSNSDKHHFQTKNLIKLTVCSLEDPLKKLPHVTQCRPYMNVSVDGLLSLIKLCNFTVCNSRVLRTVKPRVVNRQVTDTLKRFVRLQSILLKALRRSYYLWWSSLITIKNFQFWSVNLFNENKTSFWLRWKHERFP